MTVVLTGASRGIGRATARLLAARGEETLVVGRASEATRRTLAEVAALGGRATPIDCDLADARDVTRAAAACLEAGGAPDAVLHVAGVVRRARIEETTDSAWAEQLDVNLRAPFLLTRELLPAMRSRRHGRLVFVGSISSTIGAAGAAAYCASKWGLVGLVKSLAEELTDSGLSACAVLPGSVDTDMLRGSGFPPRMTAEDVAATLVHYALEAPLAHNGAVVEMFGT